MMGGWLSKNDNQEPSGDEVQRSVSQVKSTSEAEQSATPTQSSESPSLAPESPTEDPDVATIAEFLLSRKETNVEELQTAWNVVPIVLKKFPQHENVLEMVNKLFAVSIMMQKTGPQTAKVPPETISTVLSILSSFKWKEHYSLGARLIEMTGFHFQYSPSDFTPEVFSQLFSIYSTALNVDTYGGSFKPVIAICRSFPSILPNKTFLVLDQIGAHSQLRSLLLSHTEMENFELVPLLEVLLLFIDVKPISATKYVSEELHRTLIECTSRSSTPLNLQALLWQTLLRLSQHATTFLQDLDIDNLLSAALKVINGSTSISPVVRFLGVCSGKFPVKMIPSCLNHCELIQALLSAIDPLKQVDTEWKEEELQFVARLLALLCHKVRDTPTIEQIIQLRIVPCLKEIACERPLLCSSIACQAIERTVVHFPPDRCLFTEAKQASLKPVPDSVLSLQAKFHEDDHLSYLQKILVEFPKLDNEDRANVYTAIKHLFLFSPQDNVTVWLKGDFPSSFILAIVQDSANTPSLIQMLVETLHSIIMRITTKEELDRFTEMGLPEVVVGTLLEHSVYNDVRYQVLELISTLMNVYKDFTKTTKAFLDTDLPVMLISLAKTHGRGQTLQPLAQMIVEAFYKILLNLTVEKPNCELLYSKGFLEELYSLANTDYHSIVYAAVVHAVGNIALTKYEIQEQVIAEKFHYKILNVLNTEIECDLLIMRRFESTCRVLRLLSYSNTGAKELISLGILDSIVVLLKRFSQSSDVCYHCICLLCCLESMSSDGIDKILTDDVLQAAKDILKSSSVQKVVAQAACVFLIAIEEDKYAAKLAKLGIYNDIWEKMKDQEIVKGNADFERWGKSLLEKGQLFTLTVGQELMAEEDQRAMVNSLEGSFLWPEAAPASVETEGSPTASRFEGAQVPTATPILEEDKSQLTALGLDPNKPLLRVGRFCGSNHRNCSNCQSEQKLAELVFRPHSLTPQQYQILIDRGWYRRGDVDLFRMRYSHALECNDWETRVLLSEFNHRTHKSFKKVLRKVPSRLTIETIPSHFSTEEYELYNEYNINKHAKTDVSAQFYHSHAVNSPLRNVVIDGFEYGTFHQLYRLDGKLVAVGLIDVVPNGVVSLYMWYSMSKEMQKLSLGVYSALKEIEYAKELSKRNPNIKYYYLQGWNGNNTKLSYKANYTPEEFYSPCTVTDWVSGLDGVKKAQEEAKEKWKQKNSENTDGGEEPKNVELNGVSNLADKEVKEKEYIPGEAMELDRLVHQRLTGSSSVDIGHLVVCLNNKKYLSFSELLSTYQFEEEHRSLLETRLEELVLALGPELSSNMIVDMKACLESQAENKIEITQKQS